MQLITLFYAYQLGSTANAALITTEEASSLHLSSNHEPITKRLPYTPEEKEQCNKRWMGKSSWVSYDNLDGCPPPYKFEKKEKEPGERLYWITFKEREIAAVRGGLRQDEVKRKELEDKERFAKEEKESKKKEREEKKRLAKEENERKKECEEKKAKGKYDSDCDSDGDCE